MFRRRCPGPFKRRCVLIGNPVFRPSKAAAIIGPMAEPLTLISDVQDQLRRAGYLADTATGTVVHLAQALSKPVLIEGPAGTGKTQIRLQCYEGLDESKAIYEWDYRRQLLQLQLQERGSGDDLSAAGIFGE